LTRIPRLLPLIAVAIGGVVAINALAGAQSLPELVSGARAFAEDIAAPNKAEPKAKSEAAPAPQSKAATALPPGKLAIGPTPAAAAAGTPGTPGAPPAVCSTSAEFARVAGLTPAEVQLLQSLGARRGQLDDREKALDTQLQLLAAAEAKLDARIAAMNGLKGELNGLLSQVDAKKAAELAQMVKIYETMAPAQAGKVMAQLADEVRTPLAAAMKPAKLAAVMNKMPPADARKLTELVSRRLGSPAIEASRQAAAPTPPAPATAPAPAAKTGAAPAPATKTAAAPTAPRPAAPRPAPKAPAPKAPAAAPAAAAPVVTPPAAPEPAEKTG